MHDKTLADYRKNVRGLVGDSDYDLTLVDQAINWFVDEIHNRYKITYMQTNDTLSISAGDTDVDLPDDFGQLQSLWMTSPQTLDLTRSEIDYRQFMEGHANFATSASAQISDYMYFGTGLRFTAPSKTAATLNLDYFAAPPHMEDDGDECVIPDNYEEMISKGALVRLMEINEDYEEADTERKLLTPLVTAFVSRWGFGQRKIGPTVMGRGGHRRGVYRADRDF